MKPLFPLLAGLLLSATFHAPAFADEPKTVVAPVAAEPTKAADAKAQPAPEVASQTVATEPEEVNLLLIFPVQEPLKGANEKAPDEAAIQAASEAGEVWVNAKSKIFHRAGTTYYGKTKAGFFLPEAQALEQGYRGVKE